jgi:hypothetical protein
LKEIAMHPSIRISRFADVHVVASALEEVRGARAEAAVADRIRRCLERGDDDAASQWERVRRMLRARRRVTFS